MLIAYVLLSPTFGMHQYTADYANRMAAAGHDVHLITTTTRLPADRYAPAVQQHTPVATSNSGLSREIIDRRSLRAAIATLRDLHPPVVHITGPHLWNAAVMAAAQRAGSRVIHTLHDLDPHAGTRYGRLLYIWNRQIARRADVVLVHGQRYRDRLLAQGSEAGRVVWLPLLHLFVGHAQMAQLEAAPALAPAGAPEVLFFGRIAPYKGIDDLLAAYTLLGGAPRAGFGLTIAGQGALGRVWSAALPAGVTLLNRAIGDEEAIALFRRCALVVLPYTDATQSALVAAAYYFAKPVLVTDSGALAEYVVPQQTGMIVRPHNPLDLAAGLGQLMQLDVARLREMGNSGRTWYDQARCMEWNALHSLYGRFA